MKKQSKADKRKNCWDNSILISSSSRPFLLSSLFFDVSGLNAMYNNALNLYSSQNKKQ